jgi:hypothetical protein
MATAACAALVTDLALIRESVHSAEARTLEEPSGMIPDTSLQEHSRQAVLPDL